MITCKEILESLDSKKEAIKKMYEMFPSATFEQDSNSYNSREFNGFYVTTDIKKFTKLATNFYIQKESLFDYSRPKLIDKNWWIYKSSFFNVHLSLTMSFKYKDRTENIYVYFSGHNGIGYGIGTWKKKYKSIHSLLNNNKNTELVLKYKSEVESANEELEKWEKAIKKIKSCI